MNAFSPLDRLFDPSHPAFTPDGLQAILSMGCTEAEQTEMQVFATKANEGTLSPDERRKYEAWVRAGTVMSMLKAKARLLLKQTAQAT